MNLTMQSWSFESDPTDKNASDFNTAIKEKLELFYEKLQGAIIRARARWCEQRKEYGEKRTKYILYQWRSGH